MEKVTVIRYKCAYCGDLYKKEINCIKHEEQCSRIHKAQSMWDDGKTIFEINEKLHFWKEVPENLCNCTKDNCYYEYVDKYGENKKIAFITGFTKSGIKVTANNYTMICSLNHVKNYIKCQKLSN